MDFYSAYDQGFARVAACTTRVHIADPASNAAGIIEQAQQLSEQGVAIAAFPEMSLSGYAIDDLVLQDAVLDAVLAGLEQIVAASDDLLPVLVVGAPLRRGHRLFNCAVVIHRGQVLGVVPKSYLPTYREFYEARYFAAGAAESGFIELFGEPVPFGPDLLFDAVDLDGLIFHVEICEDYWVPVPPSSHAALAGATVLVNISGSPITVAKAEDREMLCRSASARCLAAYVYAAAGLGESSTDLSWDGQTMIYEDGVLLSDSERFPASPQASIADIDLDLLRAERLRESTFNDNARIELGTDAPAPLIGASDGGPATPSRRGFRRVEFTLDPPRTDIGLRRRVARFPFVPADAARLAQDCYEAYNIQVAALQQRLSAIGNPKIVIGVSGGLDSTQALLVAAKVMDQAGRPRSDILAFTMPGFGTSEHTRDNATELATSLGCTFETIDIRPSAEQMLETIGHPLDVYDVTYENVQAGLRTDYLFRLANQRGGIVLGTGDLSELALGWCTYGVGDQMSHYAVNSGVPKTLMQHLIRWVISSGQFDEHVSQVLQSILDTEITPELIPTVEGHQPQSTQASIGPYALHDFTLFWWLRRGLRPTKIAFLAWQAWHDVEAGSWPPGFPDDERLAYDLGEIRHWLEVFAKRFMTNQFKRSAMPNGPKVLWGGALSPRGDWRSPSDGNARAWLADIQTGVPDEATDAS